VNSDTSTLKPDVSLTESEKTILLERMFLFVRIASDGCRGDIETLTLSSLTSDSESLSLTIGSLSLDLLVGCAREIPHALSSLFQKEKYMEWQTHTLLLCRSSKLRQNVANALSQLAESMKGNSLRMLFVEYVFSFLFSDLYEIYTHENPFHLREKTKNIHPDAYFHLIKPLLLSDSNPKRFLPPLLFMLSSHPIIETRWGNVEDELVVGFLELSCVLLRLCDAEEKWGVGVWRRGDDLDAIVSCVRLKEKEITHKNGFLHLLLTHFLFNTATVDCHDEFSPPLCKTTAARQSTFSLLTELSHNCHHNFQYISEFIYEQNRTEKNRKDWFYLPNSHNRVNQFAGLENLGATCYMNSVLQQLFSTPFLRFHLFSLCGEDGEVVEVKAGEGEGDLSGGLVSERREEKREEKEVGGGKEERKLLCELIRLFVYLQETEKRSVATRPFFDSFRVFFIYFLFIFLFFIFYFLFFYFLFFYFFIFYFFIFLFFYFFIFLFFYFFIFLFFYFFIFLFFI
jgi:hypothetical protein